MKKVVIVIISIILIFLSVFLYARFIGTKGLFVHEYRVSNEKITNAYHGLKIVHISDLHYGSTVYKKQLEKLVNKVNKIKPDLIVYTGDLFTEEKTYDKNIIINELTKLEARIGKYFVSGNHDKPIEDYQEIMISSGFNNLDDAYELIYLANEPIIISGISSNFDNSSNITEKTSLYDSYIANLTLDDIKPIYSILLMHEPDFVDNIEIDNYDLVLAGHSHGGQVRIPFIGKLFTPYGSLKYFEEYYKINNTDLYISNGIGESILNLRLFNHPSINFYRITKK